jgi:hypothetical protein
MSTIKLKTPSNGSVTLAPEDTASDVVLTVPAEAGDLFAQGNILGTVSESGGVPTGGIIERGSNANGEFVKYADGTVNMTLAYPYTTGSVDSLVFEAAATLPTTVINSVASATVAQLRTAPKGFVIHSGHSGGSSVTNADRVKVLFGTTITTSDTIGLLHRAVFANSGNLQTALVFVEGRWF